MSSRTQCKVNILHSSGSVGSRSADAGPFNYRNQSQGGMCTCPTARIRPEDRRESLCPRLQHRRTAPSHLVLPVSQTRQEVPDPFLYCRPGSQAQTIGPPEPTGAGSPLNTRLPRSSASALKRASSTKNILAPVRLDPSQKVTYPATKASRLASFALTSRFPGPLEGKPQAVQTVQIRRRRAATQTDTKGFRSSIWAKDP